MMRLALAGKCGARRMPRFSVFDNGAAEVSPPSRFDQSRAAQAQGEPAEEFTPISSRVDVAHVMK